MSERKYFASRLQEGALLVDVLKPVGSLADDAVLHELDLILQELNASGAKLVIVDFHQTAYFGSSLLESLRVIWRHLQPLDGQMALCNLSVVGREIIQLAKFDHVWPIANTVDEARRLLT